jgi:hypothetical protein
MRAAITPPDPPEHLRPSLRPVSGSRTPAIDLGGFDGERLDPAGTIDLFRGLADQELARAEAARARARQAFALAAGFFAVVQTVAFGSFVTSRIAQDHQTATLVHHATLAGVVLGICGLALLIADSFFRSRNVTPEALYETITTVPKEGTTTDEIVRLYFLVAVSHRDANRGRLGMTALTQLLALLAIAASAWELLAALHAIA